MSIPEHSYSHTDSDGMLWRFEGSRPISKLADEVVAEVFGNTKMRRKKKMKTAAAKTRKTIKAQTPPEIDLSFLKKNVKVQISDELFTLPKFGIFSFENAHHIRSFVVPFQKSIVGDSSLFILNREMTLPTNSTGKGMKIIHISKPPKNYIAREEKNLLLLVPSDTVVGVFPLNRKDDRVIIVHEHTPVYFVLFHHQSAQVRNSIRISMDHGLQFSKIKKIDRSCWGCPTNIRISATYHGILPVVVQQLVHKALQSYEEVAIIAEADWETAVLEEIKPEDPLVVGLNGDKAYLLCKFQETIEENYYASEFSEQLLADEK